MWSTTPHTGVPWLALSGLFILAVFAAVAVLSAVFGATAWLTGYTAAAWVLAATVLGEVVFTLGPSLGLKLSPLVGGSGFGYQAAQELRHYYPYVLLLSLGWLPWFAALASGFEVRFNRAVRIAAIPLTAVFFFRFTSEYSAEDNSVVQIAQRLQYSLLLPLATVLILRHLGSDARNLLRRAPLLSGAGLAAIANGAGSGFYFAFGGPRLSVYYPLLWPSQVLAAGMIFVIAPHARRRQAARLAAVGTAAHRRHTYAYIRLKVLGSAERDFLQKSRAKLAEGGMAPRDFDAGLADFRQSLGPRAATDPSARELALGTLGGLSPWRSGLVGAGISAALSLALTLALDPGFPDLNQIAYIARFDAFSADVANSLVVLFPWVTYGFIYGYFYTRLRGTNGLTKAGWLALALLGPEILRSLLDSKYHVISTYDYTLPVLILYPVARVVVFAAALGVLWEVHLARRADVPWSRVRSIQTISPLAAPLTAIVVAATSAAVALYATTLVQRELPSSPPTPATISTSAPTAPR